VAKWVDEPEQNYTDGMVGDWSKLLTSEPAVVAEHQNPTKVRDIKVENQARRASQ